MEQKRARTAPQNKNHPLKTFLYAIRLIIESFLFAGFLVLFTALFMIAHAETLTEEALKKWDKIKPWNEKEPPPRPPEQKPFELPRLYSDKQHYNSPTDPLKKAPKIDPDAIFLTVMQSFPAKSTFNAEVSLVAGFKQGLDTWDEDYPDIADHYVGLVGKIPLYSSNEQSRQREREYQRRTDTAKQVAGFVGAIAARNQAYREMGLYRALEARAQARVKNGIAETNEQIQMLKKLAMVHSDVITQKSNVIEHRLALSGLCENVKREAINNWLKKLASLT